LIYIANIVKNGIDNTLLFNYLFLILLLLGFYPFSICFVSFLKVLNSMLFELGVII